MILFSLALREIRRSWKFGLFFIFNLSLGLAGFVSLKTFNNSLEQEIKSNSKAVLSADLAVSSRRELTESELQIMRAQLPDGTIEGKAYEFFAMLNSSKGSRLVLVKAIDHTYPFYGELYLRSRADVDQEIIGQKNLWAYPEINQQMGLEIGDQVQLGQLKLTLSNLVDKDQTQTFRAASMAPRVFIDRDLLSQSGLIQYGSTFTASYLFKFPPGVDEELIKKQIYVNLPDPQISVDTPKTAGETAGRQLGYLTDYLGLVALIALFLSALGASYIYRLFLTSRMKEIAILRTLGLQSAEAVGVYVIQATFLGTMATAPALLFSQMILPLLTQVLSSFSPFSLRPSVSLETFLISLLMAVVGSFLLSLPLMINIFDLKASKLFNEEKFASSTGGSKKYWAYLPALMLFYGLSVYQAHSWKIGSLFVASLAGVVLVLALFGYAAIRLSQFFKSFQAWPLRYSFLSLSRRASSSMALFLALGVGALLINILPQLKNTLQAEFKYDHQSKLPSLFMFDIQDEQVEQVQKVLSKNQVQALAFSPMVRARILSVNGKAYERKIDEGGFKTREEETDARFRNRGVNLSYREQLSTTEEITQGRPIISRFDPLLHKYAELSVEQKFAERMGLALNDIVLFDVQGVSVEGQIVNFRKVKWASFQPNFFILVQNGVLNEAPKTFIAAIPALATEQRNQLQAELSKEVPNVSIIDVARLVDEVLKTADKMSWSLELMAYLSLFTGYVVLYSIVRSQIKGRRWELNMLKILGAEPSAISIFVQNEFGFLSFVSSFLGAVLSVALSYLLNRYLFEGTFEWSLTQPLLSILFITGLSLFVSFLASLDVVRESPLGILKQES